MTEMRKLQVLVCEDYIDSVLRILGKDGVVQFIDMSEKQKAWADVFVPQEAPTKTLKRCSDILSKTETVFKELGLKPWEISPGKTSITREPTDELLDKIEQRLDELPLKHLAKCLAIISRVDQLLVSLEIKPEEAIANEVLLEKSFAESVEEVERELSEIEKTVALTDLISRKALVKKIQTLTTEEKTKFDEKLLALRKLAEASEKLLTLRKKAEKTIASLKTKTEPHDVIKELSTLYKIVEREKQLTEVKTKFVTTEKTFYFEAWLPKSQVKETEEKIKEAADDYCIVINEPPNSEDKVPTILKPARSYSSAFEKLALAFGHPTAGEVNPIPIMVITFSLFFGIMFADVGQGALLALVGVIITYFRRKTKLDEVGDMTRYILVSGEMFIALGISAIIFGFLFGEFFGPSGLIHPISLGSFGPFYFGGFEPTLEPMKMLRLAILIGVAHLSLGLVLRIWNETKKHNYKVLPLPVCWLWLLLGGFFMWTYFGGISKISIWLSDGIPLLATLVILPLIILIFSVGIVEGFTEGFGIGVEIFAETLSHTISYSRVMALGLIHSAMSSLFLVLGGVEHGIFPLSSIPILAVGTLLVMIIEGLVVFVHDLRLHWVEWFSKFYSGEGIIFKPFKFT